MLSNRDSELLHEVPTSPQLNTYLTSCEWRIVDMSTEYAKHCLDGKSFFTFPYFSQVITLWQIFIDSYALARKHDSAINIIFSANMMMNVFVTLFTSIEFLAKGLLTYPANFIFKHENDTSFQKKAGEIAEKYVDLIKEDAFYTVPYLSQLGTLYQSFYHAKDKSLVDAYTLFALSFEHIAKQIISLPFLAIYGISEYVTSDDSYWQKQITLKYPEGLSKEEKEQKFETLQELAKTNITSNSKYQKDVQRIKQEGDILKIKCGRYDSFIEILSITNTLGFNLLKIEGNDYIQVRIKDESTPNNETTAIDEVCKEGITRSYHYKNSIDKNTTFFATDVEVTKVHALLDEIEKQPSLSLHWVHDF